MLFEAVSRSAGRRAIAPRFNALVDARHLSEHRRGDRTATSIIRADSAAEGGRAQAAATICADAVEALIAAIYLEGGHRSGARLHPALLGAAVAKAVDKPAQSQDRVAGMVARRATRGRSTSIEGREGPDHDPVFTVSRAGRPASSPPRARQFQPRGRGGCGSRFPCARRRLDSREGAA